jgi:hypothetical protein
MRRRYLNINIKLKRHPRSVRFTVGQGGASSAEGAKDFKRICLVLSAISANCLSVWGVCVGWHKTRFVRGNKTRSHFLNVGDRFKVFT